jgi:hypothetical protein
MNPSISIPVPIITRKPRTGGAYTEIEKKIIGKFKDEYRQQLTRELRGIVMREKILPAIFNYWQGERNGRMSETESIKLQKVNIVIIINYKFTTSLGFGGMDSK